MSLPHFLFANSWNTPLVFLVGSTYLLFFFLFYCLINCSLSKLFSKFIALFKPIEWLNLPLASRLANNSETGLGLEADFDLCPDYCSSLCCYSNIALLSRSSCSFLRFGSKSSCLIKSSIDSTDFFIIQIS